MDEHIRVMQGARMAGTMSEAVEQAFIEKKDSKIRAKKVVKRKKPAIVCVSARRKMAIARATAKAGKGTVKINRLAIGALPQYAQELITEPLRLAPDVAPHVDINVNVRGGGFMGQAQAARCAIARALVAWSGDEELKRTFMAHDRYLLIEDMRMVEPKKYKGRKARARFQKSYR